MPSKRLSFDPQKFLATIGRGVTLADYRQDQVVFAQGDPAVSVFYIQSGKVKGSVLSEQGKGAVLAILR